MSRHKLSIEDFHAMGRAGILREHDRVELIDGELIDKAPIGSLHWSMVARLSTLLVRQVGDLAIVLTQSSISLPPDSEPQPDIALLKPRSTGYRDALPTARDVLLLIEPGYDARATIATSSFRSIRDMVCRRCRCSICKVEAPKCISIPAAAGTAGSCGRTAVRFSRQRF